MRPAEKFVAVMIEALKFRFPEEADKIDEFTTIMWRESTDLTEEEHEAIDNFLEFLAIGITMEPRKND